MFVCFFQFDRMREMTDGRLEHGEDSIDPGT